METWDIRSLEIGARNPQVLRSDDESRAIAIMLPAGEEMHEHQVHERAYMLVIDGQIEVSQDGETITGEPGFMAHFAPNERRAVRAMSDARLLLVLAPWPGEGHPTRVAADRAAA
jgi:quercetin dioxygenase-like cupin family protein